MQLNEMTIDQASEMMSAVCGAMESSMNIAAIRTHAVRDAANIARFTDDRIYSAVDRAWSALNLSCAQRDGRSAEEAGDECKAKVFAAIVDELEMHIDEMNKRIEYDRIETERINAAIAMVIA